MIEERLPETFLQWRIYLENKIIGQGPMYAGSNPAIDRRTNCVKDAECLSQNDQEPHKTGTLALRQDRKPGTVPP